MTSYSHVTHNTLPAQPLFVSFQFGGLEESDGLSYSCASARERTLVTRSWRTPLAEELWSDYAYECMIGHATFHRHTCSLTPGPPALNTSQTTTILAYLTKLDIDIVQTSSFSPNPFLSDLGNIISTTVDYKVSYFLPVVLILCLLLHRMAVR